MDAATDCSASGTSGTCNASQSVSQSGKFLNVLNSIDFVKDFLV